MKKCFFNSAAANANQQALHSNAIAAMLLKLIASAHKLCICVSLMLADLSTYASSVAYMF